MTKISLTVKQLIEATESRAGRPSALQSFFQCPKPASVSWTNRKLIASVNEELKLYHEHRIELCKKHGVLNLKTNQYDFVTEAADSLFKNALADLQAQTVELTGCPVKIADLSGSLSEIDLALLEPFITD